MVVLVVDGEIDATAAGCTVGRCPSTSRRAYGVDNGAATTASAGKATKEAAAKATAKAARTSDNHRYAASIGAFIWRTGCKRHIRHRDWSHSLARE